jgi:hypothetical protein
MNQLDILDGWYHRQCNGVWEHSYGVSVDTCDNPGLIVKIDVVGSDMEGKAFEELKEGDLSGNVSYDDWRVCKVVEGVFIGAGSNLNRVVEVFNAWCSTSR